LTDSPSDAFRAMRLLMQTTRFQLRRHAWGTTKQLVYAPSHRDPVASDTTLHPPAGPPTREPFESTDPQFQPRTSSPATPAQNFSDDQDRTETEFAS
jgi:hypothetical protein